MAILLIDPQQQQSKTEKNDALFPLFSLVGTALTMIWCFQHSNLMSSSVLIILTIILGLLGLYFFSNIAQAFMQICRRKQLIFLLSRRDGQYSDEEELEQKRFTQHNSYDGLWQSVVAGLGVVGFAGLLSGIMEGGLLIFEVVTSLIAVGVIAKELMPKHSEYEMPASNGLEHVALNSSPDQDKSLLSRNQDKPLLSLSEENEHKPDHHSPETFNQQTTAQQRVEQTKLSSAIEESLFEQGNEQDLASALNHSTSAIVQP